MKRMMMAFMKKPPMSLEDFRVGLNDMLADAADPHGELASIMEEGKEFISESAKYDTIFADKLQTCLDSFVDIVEYVKARAERN